MNHRRPRIEGLPRRPGHLFGGDRNGVLLGVGQNPGERTGHDGFVSLHETPWNPEAPKKFS